MKLASIKLARVAGIDPPFTVDDLSPRINVVVGPNGSGKSSICRAVSALLWPESAGGAVSEVSAIWEDGGKTLRADRVGKQVSWQTDGIDSAPPPLPPGHLSLCYTLGVRDLLQDDNATDRGIADRIRIQMSGGYDVGALRDDAFKVKSTLGKSAHKELEEARKALGKIREKFKSLAEDEDKLGELRCEKQAARRAQVEATTLEKAMKLARARKTLTAIDAELAQFPVGMDKLHGGELERLDRLEEELAATEQESEGIALAIEDACGSITQSGLGLQGEFEDHEQIEIKAAFKAERSRLQKLTDRSTELRNAQSRRASAAERVAHARRRLGQDPGDSSASAEPGGALDLEGVSQVSPVVLARIESLLKRVDSLRGKREAIEREIALLEGDAGRAEGAAADSSAISELVGAAAPVGVNALRRGADYLRDWLSAPQTVVAALPSWLSWAATLCALVAAVTAAAVLGLDLDRAWLLLAGLGVGAAVAAPLAGRLRGGSAAAATDNRELYAAKFVAEPGLEAPETWTTTAVTEALRRMDDEIARVTLEQMRDRDAASRLAPLRRDLERLTDERRSLDEERERLQSEFAVSVDSDLALFEVAAACAAYHKAAEDLCAADGYVAPLADECTGLIEKANAFLSRFGYRHASDVEGLSANLDDLGERIAAFELAERVLADSRKRAGSVAKRLGGCREQIADFFTECDLPEGDRTELGNRLARLPQYRELCTRRVEEAGQVMRLEAELSDREDLLAIGGDEAAARHAAASEEAERFDDISERIFAIERSTEEASHGCAMEEALAAETAARDALADAAGQARRAAAARFLLEEVDREHERESRPAVLQRAMEYFSAFTRNRYELLLAAEEQAVFRAKDTSAEKGLSLSQLSDGTRVQLLLAVRLAFAMDAERGPTVPLFLDEALSTADPERFRAVAESMIVLASEGRQIFYMTANPSDAKLWAEICAANGSQTPKRVELGELRGGQAAVRDIEALAAPAVKRIPEPGAMSAQEYGRALEVDAADPEAPAGSLHLFYLLRDDLDSLYTVLERARVSRLGQWESFSRSGRARRFLAPELCAQLDLRCACARSVYENRAIGRGKRIDRAVLQDSGAVSDKFIDAMSELAEKLHGDTARFVEVLEQRDDPLTKGMHTSKEEELRTYLEDRGYLDTRPVLSDEDLYRGAAETALTVLASSELGGSATEADGPTVPAACSRFIEELIATLNVSVKTRTAATR